MVVVALNGARAKLRFKKEFSRDRKACYIRGPFNLGLAVDYDDVDPELVDPEIDRLIQLLNDNWPPSGDV
jgi:hypothetical protein